MTMSIHSWLEELRRHPAQKNLSCFCLAFFQMLIGLVTKLKNGKRLCFGILRLTVFSYLLSINLNTSSMFIKMQYQNNIRQINCIIKMKLTNGYWAWHFLRFRLPCLRLPHRWKLQKILKYDDRFEVSINKQKCNSSIIFNNSPDGQVKKMLIELSAVIKNSSVSVFI